MDKNQADAIIKAMLEPDLKVQQEIQRKRARDASQLVAQRRHAWFGLGGFVVGTAIGYSIAGFNSFHGLMGAMAGVVVSALIGRMRKRQAG
ncbi:MAG: hypothetical protein ACOH1P_00910 [Lysobacter sp.]